jgi:hypothetical protein
VLLHIGLASHSIGRRNIFCANHARHLFLIRNQDINLLPDVAHFHCYTRVGRLRECSLVEYSLVVCSLCLGLLAEAVVNNLSDLGQVIAYGRMDGF